MATEPQRLDLHAVDPNAQQAVFAMERYVRDSTLEPGLYALVKIRASQLNGCAFCLDMHNREARKSSGPSAPDGAAGGRSGTVSSGRCDRFRMPVRL